MILRPFVADRKSVVADVPCARYHDGAVGLLQQNSLTEPSSFPADNLD
jgi:hypothetical protein